MSSDWLEPLKVCKLFPIADSMCDLHALRFSNVEFQKWRMQYADANIQVLDEYIEGVCADGIITICKDVCDMLVLPATCSNDNEPIEVCETYASENGYGICELADLYDNADYINDSIKYSNAGIEVIDEVITSCGDGYITVCKHVCDEVNISVILYDRSGYSVNRHFR